MALPKTVRMSKSAERARKRYLDAMRKSALTQIGRQRTLADTMSTLKAMDAQHRYFGKETARLDRVSQWLKKRGNGQDARILEVRIRKMKKEDSVNRGVAKSIRAALEASPWK